MKNKICGREDCNWAIPHGHGNDGDVFMDEPRMMVGAGERASIDERAKEYAAILRPRFCVGCRWCVERLVNHFGVAGMAQAEYYCIVPIINRVTGGVLGKSADIDCAAMRHRIGECGPEGRLWEAKEGGDGRE